MNGAQIFLTGAFGALLQEVVWWYNARHSLDEERYASLIRSRGYWITTVAFVLAAGGLVVIWYWGDGNVDAKTCLITGAASPLLVKQALKALTPPQKFGQRRFSFRDYLQ
ncbi:hypothetical protein SH591_06170 [Sphingomonas sp. LY54]|uniref:hypothetical protein n=1 Tax=Sphingomonas sp. LY54 TaxID=3095343 RepID=UPI002D79BA6C|nr:hypothetical protein [Sphingomonas sp. LY54]WRP29765.1 hypothetical protein SH591_06170 [Sphingomonas sp. LY54]